MDTLPKVISIITNNNSGAIGKLNKNESVFKFHNGSEIWFGGIDSKERMDKILGNEYSTIYINESSETSSDAFGILKTRLAEKTELDNKFYADCNPGGKSHWTYKVFILKKNYADYDKDLKNPGEYGCVQLNPADNIENIADGYIDDLEDGSAKDKLRFLAGEFSDETIGALWNFDDITTAKNIIIGESRKARRVIALDPSVKDGEGDEVGIIMGACTAGSAHERSVAVERDFSGQLSTTEWLDLTIRIYYQFNCDAIVCETNQGGDLIETSLRSRGFNGKLIKVHAKKGKYSRAEPVADIYKRATKRISHEAREDGEFDKLEEEMQNYVPLKSAESPNRMDALVYLITELLELTEQKPFFGAIT